MQIYPITMCKNRHMILKNYLYTLHTAISAAQLLSHTGIMVARGM